MDAAPSISLPRRLGPHAARWALGLLLGAAGLMKVAEAPELAETIANYRLVPAVVAQILALALPWWELLAGIALCANIWTRPALLLAAALFGAFTLAVLGAMLRGLDIHCGCFGSGDGTRVGLATLALDVAGLSLSAVLWWATGRGGKRI